MGFWILVFLMIAASAAVLVLGTRRGAGLSAGGADLQLYRDQLREVDRDLARGLIAKDEAERLRLEVSRRLLAADRALAREAGGDHGPGRAAGLVAGLALAGAVLGYAWLGAPGYPDMPRAGRIEAAAAAKANRPSQTAMEADRPAFTAPPGTDPAYLELIDQLRTAVAERPDEARGYDFLVRHETALGNYPAAWRAQERLLALRDAAGDPPLAEDYSLLGALMTEAAGGLVSPEAEQAFTRALSLDPREGTALFHAGLIYLQTGRPDRTFDLWAPLLANSPPGAPWEAPIRARIELVAQMAGQLRYQVPAPAQPGPGPDEIAAAMAMDPADRTAFIGSMVEGLAARLAAEGGSAAEWARLIHSLGILGERARARAIYLEAEQVFAGREGDLAEIRAAAGAAMVLEAPGAAGGAGSDGTAAPAPTGD